MIDPKDFGVFYSMVSETLSRTLKEAGRFSHTGDPEKEEPPITPIPFNDMLIWCERFIFPKTVKWFEKNAVGYIRGFENDSPKWDQITKRAIMRAAAMQIPGTQMEYRSLWEEAFRIPDLRDIALHAFAGDLTEYISHLSMWWDSFTDPADHSYRKNQLRKVAIYLLESKDFELLKHHLRLEGASWSPELREAMNAHLVDLKREPVFQVFTPA